MSDAKLTHCPHCHATFKVHDQQLKAAGGKVRCGSCLKVFNALENLVETDQEIIPVARNEVIPPSKTQPKNKQPASTQSDTAQSKKEPTPAKETLEDEEFIFQDDPEADSEEEQYKGKSSFTDDLNTSLINMDPKSAKPAHHFADAIEDTDFDDDFSNANDESWALKMLEEDDSPASLSIEEKTPDTAPTKPVSKSKSTRKKSSSPGDEFDDMDFSDEFIDLDKDIGTKPSPKPQSQPDSLSSREDIDPVTGEQIDNPFDQLYQESPRRHYAEDAPERGWFGTLIWLVLIGALLVLMLGQLAWFHYDKLAQYKPAQKAFAKVCEILKCELPELIDITQIKSRNLIVRSHPTIPKALIIDAIIENMAGYDQPFPDMALSFSNLNNQVVAQRLFAPSEYLAGEVASWEKFPHHTPIHISLEILDPGKNAINYKVEFFKHSSPKKP